MVCDLLGQFEPVVEGSKATFCLLSKSAGTPYVFLAPPFIDAVGAATSAAVNAAAASPAAAVQAAFLLVAIMKAADVAGQQLMQHQDDRQQQQQQNMLIPEGSFRTKP